MNLSQIYEISGVRRLPVDPVEIARSLGIKVVSYKSASEFFKTEPNELYTRCPLGFSFKEGGERCIALNENACGEQRRRFTAAHELAHCILGHLDGKVLTKRQEHDAEHFAAELLAPLVVLHKCGVSSAPEIARICGISQKASAVRLSELAAREQHRFCPTEDERRTAMVFREFTDSYAAKRGIGYRRNLYISIC